MKQYINKTNNLCLVEFEDGTGQFLMRGQVFESDKKVKRTSKGIVVKESGSTPVKVAKPKEDSVGE